MLTCLIVFLIGAHIGAKYPKQATLIVDQSIVLAKKIAEKIKGLLNK